MCFTFLCEKNYLTWHNVSLCLSTNWWKKPFDFSLRWGDTSQCWCELMNDKFPLSWIWQVRWDNKQPRSFDLTHFSFYSWGYVTAYNYSKKINKFEHIKQKNVSCTGICMNPKLHIIEWEKDKCGLTVSKVIRGARIEMK